MNTKEFGKYIENLRIKAGYQDRESLSKASDVWNSTIKRIEEGVTKTPSVDVLKKLAPSLKVTPEELMAAAGFIENNIKNIESPKNERLIRIFAKTESLPDDEIEELADLMEYFISRHQKNLKKK